MIARRIALARRVQPSGAKARSPAQFSSTAVARQASPAAESHQNDAESSSSAAPTSSLPAPSRTDKKSRFVPYAYATGSLFTRLPTPLPSDVAERSANLRKSLQQPTETTGGDAYALSLGDLAGLTMEAADASFYPGSAAVEKLSYLKACLRTQLTNQAHTIFMGLRSQAASQTMEKRELRRRLSKGITKESDWLLDLGQIDEASSPSLGVWLYNSMLESYMRRAYLDGSVDGTLVWLNRAWKLFQDMEQAATDARLGSQQSTDPSPNAASFAAMLRGVVALQKSGRYPSNSPPLEAFIRTTQASPFSFEDILRSSAFNSDVVEDHEMSTPSGHKNPDRSTEGEANAEAVLLRLHMAATHMGDTALIHELDTMRDILDGRKRHSHLKHDNLLQDPDRLSVPDVLPVQTKSKATDGELRMPFNLVTLKDHLSIVQEARKKHEDPYDRQKWMESSAMEAAARRLQHSAEVMEGLGLHKDGLLQKRTLQTWMWQWYNKLQEAVADDLIRMTNLGELPQTNKRQQLDVSVLPFLRLLPPSKLALITILELMRMCGNGGVTDGMKSTRALLQVGRAVEAEFQSEVVNKNPHMFENAQAAQALLRKRGLVNIAARRELKDLQAKADEDGVMSSIPNWTQTVRARVGSFLVQKLMEVAVVNRKATDRDGVTWEEDQPAFYSAYQYVGGKKLGVIKLNEVVATRLDKDSVKVTLHPRNLPMLVPPKPWTTHRSGGYYSNESIAMRYKDSAEQGSYLRAASERGDLDTVLAGLDVLGNTAWKVNKPVFDVMVDIWNTGKGLADMPPVEMEQPEPERPDNYDHDLKARSVYLQRVKQWNVQRASNHSQRCDVNYKLEIARAFLGERFYFPHNMDFRGRAYPMPPHLNHIGNDLCRGVLMFADSKPLGAVGLRWLRIHLANVYGFDKASFAEREQFAIQHEAEVRDSVERPLDGNQWWLKADEPWQCLAACVELAAALKHPEGPEAFESSLPVHQDGTCNGLQHYAALGGDLAGARQVNLSQGDRPSDVYSGVADLVIKVLEEDAANGVELAKALRGKVTRKVVKQTVMTTVYGVTFVGAKNQVMKQLADRGDIGVENLFGAASYLAKIILRCIGDLFSGASGIQSWLSASAKLIARSIPPQRIEEAMRPSGLNADGSPKIDAARADRIIKEQMTSVIWTTALGLPVVQPYRKTKKRQVMTSMQTVYIQDPLSSAEVSPGKQASAFPPNFIHSLDATHMILTALECHLGGLTFASVHDSYWTHAADIETMSDMIRETFIRLHTKDILQKLREEFLDRYAGYKVPVVSLKHMTVKQAEAATKAKTVHIVPEDELAQLQGEIGEVVIGSPNVSEDEDVSGDSPAAEPLSDVGAATDVQDTKAAKEKPKKSEDKTETKWEKQFKAKFVDLADLLPPIPAKGSFDVNEIKRSLYFFS